ncbi:phosphoribosylglycinamide formyltransferase [Solemya pervernicosa gill symbiont]|uniref:Phosphoribosylglycinamide formyltransferase n=2 Tax=Gammaproteobacteria incertae sedis TaxID=118884 RepID=A0A1T2L8E7_9GAMM|nr:phosphoribosylglycinamide formyltransferase [Candidatus Reidiella endopervernicosa]OOZ41387.1 phosphoribosylglycinamide formyltransferase [Solemya pervernicosa gill symbiont]QKQ27574.1 phosphoribosylglycinamide formyltransferase [Candidatus Reidiella endopervernicosa]
MQESAKRLPIVVLISGGGSNLQAIIDAANNDLPVEIRAVISNRSDAYGLERAQQAAIPTAVLDHTHYEGREAFDTALIELIDSHQPQLVVLAGFMRILTPEFVRHYQGRLINIHPSLLPEFRGLHTHRRAIEAAASHHGATVHFVTDELDGGPLILQAQVPVLADDSEELLAARVLEQEHKIYPLAIRWFAEGRLEMRDHTVVLDNQPLEKPAQLEA